MAIHESGGRFVVGGARRDRHVARATPLVGAVDFHLSVGLPARCGTGQWRSDVYPNLRPRRAAYLLAGPAAAGRLGRTMENRRPQRREGGTRSDGVLSRGSGDPLVCRDEPHLLRRRARDRWAAAGAASGHRDVARLAHCASECGAVRPAPRNPVRRPPLTRNRAAARPLAGIEGGLAVDGSRQARLRTPRPGAAAWRHRRGAAGDVFSDGGSLTADQLTSLERRQAALQAVPFTGLADVKPVAAPAWALGCSYDALAERAAGPQRDATAAVAVPQ